MNKVVISVENLSKSYRLGQIGTGTFSRDLKVWLARVRGRPNPLLRIGETDFGNQAGEEIWALKDVTFSVEQGEVLGIIGRNGAGKSTLLKILSRVTAPTSGVVKVKGHVASLLEVGTGFHPELTGRENVYLNGAILGMDRREIDRKFAEIVDFSGVEKFIDTPVKRYSSGMYVRLAFAVAAHLDPEILVVDEVLAVGDAEFQRKCLGKMGEVAKGGRTVLFVSHNMGAIQSLCRSCIWLNQGQISSMDETGRVVSEYLKQSFPANHDSGSFSGLTRRRDQNGFEFVKYELLDSSNNKIRNVTFYSDLTIRLYGFAEKRISGAVLAVNWFDESGYLLNRANTRSIGIPDFEIEKGEVIFDIEFNRIPLIPNSYRVSIALQDDGRGYYDWLERAIMVNVEDNPNANVRFIPGQSNGSTWLPVKFKIPNR